ncbi:hypothetical protein SASPL_105350 [Salvia splendens]|uniref:GAG-pre-integrase domain-containing protein n=1 Tax=Salvia splendens TaxID=180675 RepID=A0A8X8YL55_SALSN|nr:hypothetical protein SASPL_105350 [Salvia splendens]
MLCLSDDVIIEVVEQETAAALWTKLESLYMTKSLTNKLLLKQLLFRLRMHEGMPLRDHLENLNKILLDLRNIDVKVEDEDTALILLVSLPESYENFVESFMNGKETLSLEDVRSALYIREDRQQATSTAIEYLASGLSVTGKGQKKFGQKKQNSKSSKGPKAPNSEMRLGHMGERGMRIMSNRDFLSGHKVQKLDFCEHCVFGKLHRNNAVEDLEGVDKQVELQVTHDESESQLQGGEDQHTTAEATTDTTSSDVHP